MNKKLGIGIAAIVTTLVVTSYVVAVVEDAPVVILTNKQVYKLGEPVYYTIINKGSEEVYFSNTLYSFTVYDSDGNSISNFPAPHGMVSLQPGERADGTWHQQIGEGDVKALPGVYMLDVGWATSDPITIQQ